MFHSRNMSEMASGCCVCSKENDLVNNRIVYCAGHGCNVAVHQACYGISSTPSGAWFCRKCESQERAARVRCKLCPQTDGALKRTEWGGWCHMVCALYIPEAKFGNGNTREPILLESISPDRFGKPCYICKKKKMDAAKVYSGACMRCHGPGCQHYFHVTCAQSQGLLCAESENSGQRFKLYGYCPFHYQKFVIHRKGDAVTAGTVQAACDQSEPMTLEDDFPLSGGVKETVETKEITDLPSAPLTSHTNIQETIVKQEHAIQATSVEEFLMHQLNQTTQFFVEQSQHFEVEPVLKQYYQLKSQNSALEEEIKMLASHRNELSSLAARLSKPFTNKTVQDDGKEYSASEKFQDDVSAHWQTICITHHQSGPVQEDDSQSMPESPCMIPQCLQGPDVHAIQCISQTAVQTGLSGTSRNPVDLIHEEPVPNPEEGHFFTMPLRSQRLESVHTEQVPSTVTSSSLQEAQVQQLKFPVDPPPCPLVNSCTGALQLLAETALKISQPPPEDAK